MDGVGILIALPLILILLMIILGVVGKSHVAYRDSQDELEKDKEQDVDLYLKKKMAKNIETIKNCVIFFTVIMVIGMVFAIISAINMFFQFCYINTYKALTERVGAFIILKKE